MHKSLFTALAPPAPPCCLTHPLIMRLIADCSKAYASSQCGRQQQAPPEVFGRKALRGKCRQRP